MMRKVITGRIRGRTAFSHVMEVEILLNHGVLFGFECPSLGVARFLGTATTRRIWSDRGRILRNQDHETKDLRHTCRYRLS